MTKIKVIRHGDLILIEGVNREDHVTPKKDNCVLDGEVSGHHHRLDDNADVLVCEPTKDNQYFRGVVEVPTKPAKLSHEEHNTLILPVGKYSAYVQREYDPIEERVVKD